MPSSSGVGQRMVAHEREREPRFGELLLRVVAAVRRCARRVGRRARRRPRRGDRALRAPALRRLSNSPRCVERIDAAHAWIAWRDAVIVISRARCFSSNAARADSPSAAISGPRSTPECYDDATRRRERYEDAARRSTQSGAGCRCIERTFTRALDLQRTGPRPQARRTRANASADTRNNAQTIDRVRRHREQSEPPTTASKRAQHVAATLRRAVPRRHARLARPWRATRRSCDRGHRVGN